MSDCEYCIWKADDEGLNAYHDTCRKLLFQIEPLGHPSEMALKLFLELDLLAPSNAQKYFMKGFRASGVQMFDNALACALHQFSDTFLFNVQRFISP